MESFGNYFYNKLITSNPFTTHLPKSLLINMQPTKNMRFPISEAAKHTDTTLSPIVYPDTADIADAKVMVKDNKHQKPIMRRSIQHNKFRNFTSNV